MDPSDVAFIKGLAAFGLFAVTGLSAFWLRLRAKALADQPTLERLQEDMLLARHDLETRVLELEERLDFAERRLLHDNSSAHEPPPLRETTPV